MATIRYCLPITRFTQDQYHKITTILEQAILPKLGFNRHNPKAVLYGPKRLGGKALMYTHTEQLVMSTESIMSHLRGNDEAGTLQRILFNLQQLIVGANDFILT